MSARAMPDETLPAADAAVTGQEPTATEQPNAGATPAPGTTTAEGESPRSTATASEPTLTPAERLEQARQTLRNANTREAAGRDPLEESAHSDPLSDEEGRGAEDPLGIADEPTEEQPAAGTGETPAPETGEQPTETETQTEQQEQEEEEEQAPAEAEEPKGDKQRNRVRVRPERIGDRDFAIVELADREGISLKEAEARLYGEAAATEGKEGDEQQPGKEPTVSDLETQIESLRKEKKQAAQNLDSERVEDLRDQIDEAREKLSELKAKTESRQSQQAQSQAAAEAASKAQAVKFFPDAAKADTALFRAIAADVARLENSNPAFFRDPEWAETLAAKHAARLGIAPAIAPAKPAPPAAAKPVAKATPAPAAAPAKPARPVPSPASGSAQASVVRPSQPSAADITAKLAAAKASGDIESVRTILRQLTSGNKA